MTNTLFPHPHRRGLLIGAAAAGLAAAAGCKPASPADAVNKGFTADGLKRLRARLEQSIGPAFAPGLVALVARGPHVETVVLGQMAFDGPPMARDSIFRIASMTKAVTAVAVMMLVEEGKLRLDEPVERLLPELANRRVLRSLDAQPDDTVPAKRPITVKDLLTFRCGLGLIPAPPGTYPIQKVIANAGIVGFGPPDPAMPWGPDEWMRKIAALPLIAQPGEDFYYTAGSNLQGVLVARATGKPLSAFCQERIFAPLGMKDTAYFAPPAKIGRLVTAYRDEGDKLVVADPAAGGKWSRQPAFEQGDAGLVSTADDYLPFARMLLADGVHQGKALLSPASVKAMKTDHLTHEQRIGGRQILYGGRGWGYGMSVVVDRVAGQPAPGSFGWNGGFGSSWISDPAKDLTMILLTQHEFHGPTGDPIHPAFQMDAYQALA